MSKPNGELLTRKQLRSRVGTIAANRESPEAVAAWLKVMRILWKDDVCIVSAGIKGRPERAEFLAMIDELTGKVRQAKWRAGILSAFEAGRLYSQMETNYSTQRGSDKGCEKSAKKIQAEAEKTKAKYLAHKTPRVSFTAAMTRAANDREINPSTAKRHLKLLGITAKSPGK